MDEPTAVLAPQEIEELVQHPARDGRRGQIDHLHQPQAARGDGDCRPGDRAAQGQGDRGRASRSPTTTRQELARLMVGRDVLFQLEKEAHGSRARWCLQWRICTPRTTKVCRPCAAYPCNVRAGEIVGLAGVAGNGQSELAQVITGLRNCTQGQVLAERRGYHQPPGAQAASSAACRYIPEDRTARGHRAQPERDR